MDQELAIKKDEEFSIIEKVVMQGDLSKLNPEQRVTYYRRVCESSGLNPFTTPFAYILLNGKLTLYAKKDCTEQLRRIHGVSIEALEDKIMDDLYIVTAKAKDKYGRSDQAKGAVVIGNLKGEAKANAIMKAETKAKRRVTLSICGMGWNDESEVESIPNAKKIEVDVSTGEIKESPEVIAEINQTITAQQMLELKIVLDECDPKYREIVYSRMKQEFGSNDLSGIPRHKFEGFRGAFRRALQQSLTIKNTEAECTTEEGE